MPEGAAGPSRGLPKEPKEPTEPVQKAEKKDKNKEPKGPGSETLRKVAAFQASVCTSAILSAAADLENPLAQQVHPDIKKAAEEGKAVLVVAQKEAETAMKKKDIENMFKTGSTKDVTTQLKPHIDAISLFGTMMTALRQSEKRKYGVN